ncbi:MAG: hypothetical protein JOY71_11910 [Acetobacteraceae bacterium]|nr:hypothetical protein [Acetobacteraceae bacterium]
MRRQTSRASAVYLRLTNGPPYVQRRFGTVRGLGRLCLARAEQAAGRLRPFERPDWARVRRLVFVCAGNICRSAYADHRAKLLGYSATSMAISGASGCPADPTACAVAERRGIDLHVHRSCNIADFGVAQGDLLVAMEPHQARTLMGRFGAAPGVQVTLLGLWSRPSRPHLHDPHLLTPGYFDTCFALIDSAVRTMLEHLDRAR